MNHQQTASLRIPVKPTTLRYGTRRYNKAVNEPAQQDWLNPTLATGSSPSSLVLVLAPVLDNYPKEHVVLPEEGHNISY